MSHSGEDVVMKMHEIRVKTIMVDSKLPDADYVINPYIGCVFGCAYCYASFMGRFVGESIDNWGNYLYVKINAPELLAKELNSLSPRKRESTVLLSSVTDPYQYAERKYEITRNLLNLFAQSDYPGMISILTKSPLVTRDIDILKRLPAVEVGLTITSTDDQVSRELEVRAPSVSARLEALRSLNAAGIPTYAFVGPILPHFFEEPALLERLFATIADTGVSSVFVEHMNLRPYIRKRIIRMLQGRRPDANEIYSPRREKEYRIWIDEYIKELVSKYGLSLRLGQVLTHGDSTK